MIQEYDIPVNEAQAKEKLREKFIANSTVKDVRVIDMLVIKVRIFFASGTAMSLTAPFKR